MAGANGVEAVAFHERDAAVFCRRKGGRPEQTVVMVQAAALQFSRPAR